MGQIDDDPLKQIGTPLKSPCRPKQYAFKERCSILNDLEQNLLWRVFFQQSWRKISVLKWALIFLVISIVAGFFGFSGISAATATIARVLFGIFLVVFLIFLILALMAGQAIF
jgi:uncharacterized membrane protein YtjA (UPF0391 family)